jgi:hypothetical protein
VLSFVAVMDLFHRDNINFIHTVVMMMMMMIESGPLITTGNVYYVYKNLVTCGQNRPSSDNTEDQKLLRRINATTGCFNSLISHFTMKV